MHESSKGGLPNAEGQPFIETNGAAIIISCHVISEDPKGIKECKFYKPFEDLVRTGHISIGNKNSPIFQCATGQTGGRLTLYYNFVRDENNLTSLTIATVQESKGVDSHGKPAIRERKIETFRNIPM